MNERNESIEIKKKDERPDPNMPRGSRKNAMENNRRYKQRPKKKSR